MAHKLPSLLADRMELCGNTDLYLDCCTELIECSDMLMLLRMGRHRVAVWGKELTATDYSRSGLHIRGVIAAIEFDGGI